MRTSLNTPHIVLFSQEVHFLKNDDTLCSLPFYIIPLIQQAETQTEIS